MEFERIVTHNDFDGIVSAAVCSHALKCKTIIFSGPMSVSRAEISITARDVVCDLPYPLECGLWFDHHPGNLDAVRLRGIDPAAIPGRFEAKPSCARVVSDHFTAGGMNIPAHLAAAVDEADMIDSFDYRSVDEWRAETPGKLVDMSLKSNFPSFRDKVLYLGRITALLVGEPLESILQDSEVSSRLEQYQGEEKKMREMIGESVMFLSGDSDCELIIMDFTKHKRKPRVIRNLAFLLHPGALGAMTIDSIFRGGKKTNDLAVSISLSMNMTGKEHCKDMGEIMRILNIGDGHIGAAAGTLHCGSKQEMLKEKQRLIERIWELWKTDLRK